MVYIISLKGVADILISITLMLHLKSSYATCPYNDSADVWCFAKGRNSLFNSKSFSKGNVPCKIKYHDMSLANVLGHFRPRSLPIDECRKSSPSESSICPHLSQIGFSWGPLAVPIVNYLPEISVQTKLPATISIQFYTIMCVPSLA